MAGSSFLDSFKTRWQSKSPENSVVKSRASDFVNYFQSSSGTTNAFREKYNQHFLLVKMEGKVNIFSL